MIDSIINYIIIKLSDKYIKKLIKKLIFELTIKRKKDLFDESSEHYQGLIRELIVENMAEETKNQILIDAGRDHIHKLRPPKKDSSP